MVGEVIVTGEQTAGKGQRGNRWLAEPGQNFTLSVILAPSFLSVSDQFLLSQCIALGVHRYISLHTEDVRIKWPNDVLIGDRKVAGILIENMVRGTRVYAAVAGIGLNMNQLVFESPRAVSLAALAGKRFDLSRELETLLLAIEHYYAYLERGEAEYISKAYPEALYGLGERRLFYVEGIPLEAAVAGITPAGRLLLSTDAGLRDFGVQELTWGWAD